MLKNTFHPTMFMAMIPLVFSLLGVLPALAVTFTVNSTLDQPDDLTIPGTCHTAANTCTLRAAVMQANRTSGAGATIIVPPGVYTLTIPAAVAGGEENGDLDLTTPTGSNPIISIIGAGVSTTIIDANQLDRAFHVHAARRAIISGMTIRNGFMATGGASPVGGGIFNEGSLTLIDATITHNRSTGSGGGIYNVGNLTVMNITISQNKADVSGGGIYNDTGITNMNMSTLSGNSAVDGGGIGNDGDLTVNSSTLSQNNANNNGGAIHNSSFGTANINNTSIVFNGADTDRAGGRAGGVYNLSPFFNLRNTLVAGNIVSNAPIFDDCTGTLNSFGRNLFWMVVGCTVNNAAGGNWGILNALNTLGPLQNNGGPTWTHALLPGSNAIDGGDPVQGCIDPNSLLLATDQRGAARVVGLRCDIGAFEYGAKLPRLYLPLIKR